MPSWRNPAVYRASAGALVGGLIPLITWAVTTAGLQTVPRRSEPWNGFAEGLAIGGATVVLLVLAAWPALWALGVRPAWHVALPAPIAALLVIYFLATTAGAGTSPIALAAALSVVYAVIAVLTRPAGQTSSWWWELPLMSMGGPAPMTGLGRTAARLPDLPGPGVPLLAPDLPGYAFTKVSSHPGELRYGMRPEALHQAATPVERQASTIMVVVRPRVDPPAPGSPYEQAGPRMWRQTAAAGIAYVVDRDDATVVLRAGPRVPASAIHQAATTLAPRTWADFHPGTSAT